MQRLHELQLSDWMLTPKPWAALANEGRHPAQVELLLCTGTTNEPEGVHLMKSKLFKAHKH